MVESIRGRYRRWSYTIGTWFGALLVVGAIAYTTWRIGVESRGPLSGEAEAIGELAALVGGIAGSFLASRSALRSHARSAFRRLLSMYNGLGEIARISVCESPEEHESALATIGAIASVHYGTARDALEDWSDLAPQQVAELRENLTREGEAAAAHAEADSVPSLGVGLIATRGGSQSD